jgi:hypothetical protein
VLTLIPGGYGATLDPAPRQVPAPFSVGTGNSNNAAHLLIDPRDDSTVMLLERGGGRVWTNPDIRTQPFRLESFTHPFWDNLHIDGMPGRWTPCSIPRYGVVMGLSSYGADATGFERILWRPG